MINTKDIDFGFNGVIWHEVGAKLLEPINLFEKLFNERLHLKDYGSSLEHILFYWLIHLPEQKIHEEHFTHSRKKKELFFLQKANLAAIKEAENQRVLSILADAYLEGIRKIPSLKLKDFDYLSFKRDVQNLFQEQGWLELAEAS